MHFRNLKKAVGDLRWRIREIAKHVFVENSESKKLERALQELLKTACKTPLHAEAHTILFFTVRPWVTYLSVEALVAARLRSLGHKVEYLICNNDLPFCYSGSVSHAKPYQICTPERCALKLRYILPPYSAHSLGAPSAEAVEAQRHVDTLSLADCFAYEWRGLQLGHMSLKTARHYFRRTQYTDLDLPIWRSMLRSAVVVADRFGHHMDAINPDTVVMLNGALYSEQIAGAICRERKVPFVTHELSHLNRLVFAKNRPVWEDLNLDKSVACGSVVTSRMRNEARKLLDEWTVRKGHQGRLWWKNSIDSEDVIRSNLQIGAKPLAVAYSNLPHETTILDDGVFKSQYEWAVRLVDYFRKRPDLDLVFRVHPAEQGTGTRRVIERFLDVVKPLWGTLPENVRVVPSDSLHSSYAIADMAHVALVFNSTLGMELVYRGLPVITAARIHYDRRGFTVDPTTQDEYFDAVSKYMADRHPVTREQRDALVDYIAYFYFLRLIHCDAFRWVDERIARGKLGRHRIFSGRCSSLENICSLVIEGREWWR